MTQSPWSPRSDAEMVPGAPALPYPPSLPSGPPPPWPPPPPVPIAAPVYRRNTADVVATVILFVLEVAVIGLILAFAFFALVVMLGIYLVTLPGQMMCDGDNCPPGFENWIGGVPMTLFFVDIVLGLGISIGGAVFAAVRRSVMWIWPAIGVVVTVGVFLAVLMLA